MHKLSLTKQAIDDMVYFTTSQPKLLVKIVQLFESISKTPFNGIGKPEALKNNLSGQWSRRITDEHRMVYYLKDDLVVIVQCRRHYN